MDNSLKELDNNTKISSNITDSDDNNIAKKAFKFAVDKFSGKYRKGKDHRKAITHPVGVANLIRRYKPDAINIDTLLAVAYLHDVIEDTETSYQELVNEFGEEIAKLVLNLTNDKEEIKKKGSKAEYLAEKMINMSDDVLEIKLCDRLNNISDLAIVDSKFKDKYINETLYIIKYLVNNRKLTIVQFNIIENIVAVLEWLINDSYCEDSIESQDINLLVLKMDNIKEKESNTKV